MDRTTEDRPVAGPQEAGEDACFVPNVYGLPEQWVIAPSVLNGMRRVEVPTPPLDPADGLKYITERMGGADSGHEKAASAAGYLHWVERGVILVQILFCLWVYWRMTKLETELGATRDERDEAHARIASAVTSLHHP